MGGTHLGAADIKKPSGIDSFSVSQFLTENSEDKSPVAKPIPQIQIDPKQLARLASSGSSVPQSFWAKLNPLWTSPLGIFSLTGCSNKNDIVNVPSDEPDSGPTAVDHNLVLTGLRDLQGEVEKELSFQFIVINSDGDPVRVNLQEKLDSRYPENATLRRLSDSLWEFNWTPQRGQEGDFEIKINATSGTKLTSGNVKINVLPKDLTELCASPGGGIGSGTREDPFTFRVLVAMDEATRAAIENGGWSIDAGIRRMFSELNAGFNNGELANYYNFSPLPVRFYPNWDTTPYPSVSETEEDEDTQLIFDINYGRAGSHGYFRTILGEIDYFDPQFNATLNAGFMGIVHEFGHFRGAIDLYMMGLSTQSNFVFPGQGYAVSTESYMSSGTPWEPTWDPFSAGIINAAGNDAQRASQCRNYWMSTWVPRDLSVKALDGENNPLPEVEFKIYRLPARKSLPLTDSTLWYSGNTNAEGIIALPEGITSSTDPQVSYYDIFLGVVRFNGESYLNWYDNTQLAVPFLQGTSKLVLEARADQSTIYHPPTNTDLEVSALQISSNTLAVNQWFTRQFTVKNNGPQAMEGNITYQFMINRDQDWGPGTPNGGRYYSVSLNPGESLTIESSNLIPPNVVPGNYYLLVKAEPSAEGFWDPEDNNNIAVSTPITVTE